MWEKGGHEWSEVFGGTENLWNKEIFPYIKEFRNKKILEIAPGYGRITQFLSILAKELIVVDLNPLCIQKTKEKLGHHVLAYFVGDGKSFPFIKDNSQDLVYSFDSFVHMHINVIDDYLKEIYRVLTPGGKGIIHHSNLWGGSENSFENNAGRSNMTPFFFGELIKKHNMKIVEQKEIKINNLIDRNNNIISDTISIFEKNG
jgi:SAM-dependent methyltransferase